MENTPEAPAPAPAGESVATPTTNTEPAAAPAPDMHGFTSEDLASMRTFFDNNGGFDAVKSKISNPTPAPAPAPIQPEAQMQQMQPTSQPQAPVEPKYTPPKGSITAQEFLAQQYFQGLSRDPKYEAISEQIASGDVLKEMAGFNIQPLNQDGSINDDMVRKYLDLKAQTVPAKGTGTEPNASTAPTVEYYQIQGDKITQMDDAYKILQQDMQLQAAGQGHHPMIQAAEEFIRTGGRPVEQNKK